VKSVPLEVPPEVLKRRSFVDRPPSAGVTYQHTGTIRSSSYRCWIIDSAHEHSIGPEHSYSLRNEPRGSGDVRDLVYQQKINRTVWYRERAVIGLHQEAAGRGYAGATQLNSLLSDIHANRGPAKRSEELGPASAIAANLKRCTRPSARCRGFQGRLLGRAQVASPPRLSGLLPKCTRQGVWSAGVVRHTSQHNWRFRNPARTGPPKCRTTKSHISPGGLGLRS
jgi:hypothetical protein